MSIQALFPVEDQIFEAIWVWIASLGAQGPDMARVFKGFQNLTPSPIDATSTGDPELATYAVLSPGIMQRQDQGRRDYDAANNQVILTRGTTYSYQLDCYGPHGPDWANKVAIAWNSGPAADWFGLESMTPDSSTPVAVVARTMAPLYADEPAQMNILNAERQFEQRFMVRLYVHVTQSMGLPADLIPQPTTPDTWPVPHHVPADYLFPPPEPPQPQAADPRPGLLMLTGFAPNIGQPQAPQAADPGAGALTLAGFAPEVGQSHGLSPIVGALVLAGYAPSVSRSQAANPGVGALTLTGFAPSISQPTPTPAPEVVTRAIQYNPAFVNSQPCIMPSGVVAGDLLIALFASLATPSITSFTAGWTQLATTIGVSANLRFTIFAKIATGGDSLTVNLSGATLASSAAFRVTGCDSVSKIAALVSIANSTANPDPPAVTPSPGVGSYLAIAAVGWTNTTSAVAGYPTGFSNTQTNGAPPVSNRLGVATAERAYTSVSSIDPGPFTIAGVADTAPATIVLWG